MFATDDTATLRAARGFQSELKERAEEIEAARKLPSDLSERFAKAGFYRSCVPAAYGGLELPPSETAQMVELLAQGDGAAAWCSFIGATSGTVLALIPEASAREIFHSPEVRICGVFAPNGRAEHSDGGFQVTGRWAWGSGTQNADYILAGSFLTKGGEIETSESGAPRSHMMIVPASSVRFHDTWHVSGLCGTGSTDFEIDNVFVPEARATGYLQRNPVDRALYKFSLFGLLGMGIAAVTLGIARASIQALVELAAAKKPQAGTRSLSHRSHTQMTVAEAEAQLRAARAFFYEAIEDCWQEATSAGTSSLERRRDLRLATTHAVRSSVAVVDAMYNLGGGSSVYRSSPLQRMFRDVHTASQHMMVGPSTLELTGRLLLGVDVNTTQL